MAIGTVGVVEKNGDAVVVVMGRLWNARGIRLMAGSLN